MLILCANAERSVQTRGIGLCSSEKSVIKYYGRYRRVTR